MKEPSMDQLLLLSREQAVLKNFDAQNFTWYFWYLAGFFLFNLLLLVIKGFSSAGLLNIEVIPLFLSIVLTLVLFWTRKRPKTEEHFYKISALYLLVQFLLLFFSGDGWNGVSAWVFIYPWLFLPFNFKVQTYFNLYGVTWGLGLVDSLIPEGFGAGGIASSISVTIINATCLAGSYFLMSLAKKRFLANWDEEYGRNKDRLRMKQELEHAREIQLSLLPPGTPQLKNLEISCTSIPATEVGGDYYEYFELSDAQLLLVIGDVSGHGVASGLVLSGVRSCLYMMKESLPRPKLLLERLNRMLKATTDKRMFMTFMAMVFDTDEGKLTLSSAGHPPTIYFDSGTQKLSEIKQYALPLGGILKATYQEAEVPIKKGDFFVFYTDGLTEAMDEKNQEYGLGRMMERLRKSVFEGKSAQGIRDALLDDVHRFTDGEEQADDITLVVVKVK